MVHFQTAWWSFALLGIAFSVLDDCVALTLRAAQRPGRPLPLEGVKMGLSRMIGRLLLAVCVPGAVIATLLLIVRSWDDNIRVGLLPVLFLAGVGLGAFMNANFRSSPQAIAVRQ